MDEGLKNNDSPQENVSVSLEMGSGSIKEKFVSSLEQLEADINSETEIVLITPDMGKKTEKDEYFVPNLHNGIFRIHAFLHEHGIRSVLLCSDISDTEKAWELIEKHKPPFVAFSPYYDTMQNDLDHIDRMCKLSPDSTIIVGGVEASLNPQWNMLEGLIDILIRGEGEFPLLELIQRYRKFLSENNLLRKPEFLEKLRESFNTNYISGVSIADEGGILKPIYVKERLTNEQYQDINLIAFQKNISISPIEKYWKLSREMFGGKKDTYFRIVSSSHCPFKCIFCQSSVYSPEIFGKQQVPILYVTPENMMKIFHAVREQYPFIKDIYIDDDDFFIFKQRAVELLNKIIQDREPGKPLENITFQCKTRTDNINPETCQLLKKAGFVTVSLGSESYSPKELEYMRKRNSPEKNLEAIKILVENQLHVAENYILYTPITTPDTFYESASQICYNIRDFDIDGGATLFLTPLPGTDLCGDQTYETIQDFPYKEELFKDKLMFRNNKTGYEYIGEEIKVPGTDILLPHPQILLPNNPIVRKASLDALLHLPETVKVFREIAGELNLSRSFITLANLSASFKALYKLTGESRWEQLNKEVEEIVRKSNKNNGR